MPSLKTLRHQEILFARLFEDLTQLRIDEPEHAFKVASKRKRRKKLTSDGRLNLLAADGPSRRSVKVGSDTLALADRKEFLTRIVRVLSADAVDGVIATIDLMEELLLLHALMQSRGLPPFLDDQLLIISLNCGGLADTTNHITSPSTGPSAKQCAEWKFDGVKTLLQNCPGDAESSSALQQCAQAVSESNAARLPLILEPHCFLKTDKSYKLNDTKQALTELLGIVSALGDSSRYLWLQLPFVSNFSTVAQATTAPILLSQTKSGGLFLNTIKDGLAAHHNIRGTVIGSSVLFLNDEDPVEAATSVHDLVHKSVPEKDSES